MARLYGSIHLTGTIGNLTLYRINGKCYARTKSSLDKKRVAKDPAFARSRQRAQEFGIAANLVKSFYYTLPKAVRKHGLFGKLTTTAACLLREGKRKEEVVQELQQQYSCQEKSLVIKQPLPGVPLNQAKQIIKKSIKRSVREGVGTGKQVISLMPVVKAAVSATGYASTETLAFHWPLCPS